MIILVVLLLAAASGTYWLVKDGPCERELHGHSCRYNGTCCKRGRR